MPYRKAPDTVKINRVLTQEEVASIVIAYLIRDGDTDMATALDKGDVQTRAVHINPENADGMTNAVMIVTYEKKLFG